MENFVSYLGELVSWVVKLLGNPSWIGFSAIATFLMALATFLLLRHYARAHKERENVEIAERIVQPLIENLTDIIDRLKSLYISRSFRPEIDEIWKWPKIKQNCSLLIYRLPKSVRRGIGVFHDALQKLIYLHNQCSHLDHLIIKEITDKIGDRVTTGARGTYYELKIGGKFHQITFYHLIFKAQTLDEFIEELKKDPTIPSKDIEHEKFVIDGRTIDRLGGADFMEITSSIFQKAQSDPKIQEYVRSSREVHKNAQILKKDLDNLLRQTGAY